MTETSLVVLQNIVPENIFKEGGAKSILDAIKKEVSKHEPDISTVKGRKEIASLAHKVAQSKTFLDNMGKDVKEKYKKIIDPIDKERKTIRDELDALKEEVRRPLTEWEEEQERIKTEKEALGKFNSDWDQAIIDNDLFNREREIARKEAELKRIEEEKRAKEEAERLEKERIEREERLKFEAAEKARIEAEERVRKEKEDAMRRQVEAEQAARRAEEEKKMAEERARIESEQAEKKRLADLEEAARRAELEKQMALEKQRREQEAKEQAERDRIAHEKAIEDARKSDTEHRAKINRMILETFVARFGLSEETGKAIICAIAKNEIENVSINY